MILPNNLTLSFKKVKGKLFPSVEVKLNHLLFGSILNDNRLEEDNYKFHDVFHICYAVYLGWSPCTRAILGQKRKHLPLVDEVEDGARAIITEEALSLIIFNEVKANGGAFDEQLFNKIWPTIQLLTKDFEVKTRTKEDWHVAIKNGYNIFNTVIYHNYSSITFDVVNKKYFINIA